MSVRSDEIIDQLPSLRRYAAALVGGQERADELVELCLERLLAHQAHLGKRALRLTLFGLFDRIYDEWLESAQALDEQPATGDGLRNSLHALPIEERKALLLVTVERFSHADAAAILRSAPAVVARRVLAARERLHRALALRVLVIEDEPMMAMNIAHIMRHMGHEVCGVAQTRREALARVRESQPNLILADVRLRDGDSGIATVREIVRQRSVPVIFITGHAHELLGEQPVRPAMVVGKPFAPRTLEAAVRRVLGGTFPT
jgi:CheY-like chemotaxis protein/DNA-directed RNA polymerase specialized sigma24 family protein